MTRPRCQLLPSLVLPLLLSAAGCGEEVPPAQVAAPSADDAAHFKRLKAAVTEARELDADGLRDAYRVRHVTELGYDPANSVHLDLIQESSLALDDAELKTLGDQGLMLSTRQEFPTFLRGYAAIYEEDLPVFIGADPILEALHRSYDQILLTLEVNALIPALDALLTSMRSGLDSAEGEPSVRADVDTYLTTAHSLLRGRVLSPKAGGSQEQVQGFVDGAMAADGIASVGFFGMPRMLDFSQFIPRGHYTSEEIQTPVKGATLPTYFRAMIWLGRVDLRLIETHPDGTQQFHPLQYQATLLLDSLLDKDARSNWQYIDDAVRLFVGESDSLTVPEVASLVADLGGTRAAQEATAETVSQTIVEGGYGKQQIASHLMVNGGEVKTLPLSRSFLLFGQRYIVDSHVFSEATYDRIGRRLMPDPLDAAFAALGNDQALPLLGDLDEYDELPGALGAMRVLVDDHDQEFWDANLYNLWMQSLRTLSPNGNLQDPGAKGLPEIAGTQAWGRRILNTQLGSWSQLRHDTLLYAKQSYSGIGACEFPDAYVEPSPEFFGAIERYADHGARIVNILTQAADSQPELAGTVESYFSKLRDVAMTLKEMAEYQRQGTPFSEEHMAFVNDAVRVDTKPDGCVTVEIPDGWYADLFFDRAKSIEADPVVADVHTQPADAGGTIVGKILHVGTGYPRLMVMTAETCSGPKAYVGMAYAYHEQVTEDFDRLTDERWAEQFWPDAERPADVPWVQPLLAD